MEALEAVAQRLIDQANHVRSVNRSLAFADQDDLRRVGRAALALGPCVRALESAEVLAMLVRDWADHSDIACRGETCAWCYSAGAWPKITAALSAARAACAGEGA